MIDASLSILRAEMVQRCKVLPPDASANDVMLWASIYIDHLERALANFAQEERERARIEENAQSGDANVANGGSVSLSHGSTAGLKPNPFSTPPGDNSARAPPPPPPLHESPKVSGEKEALIPFGSPHSALREISRNLERNSIPKDDAELAELLEKDSFLTDLLQ